MFKIIKYILVCADNQDEKRGCFISNMKQPLV